MLNSRKTSQSDQGNEEKGEQARAYFSLASQKKADTWKEFNTKSPDHPTLLEKNKKDGREPVISMSHAFFEDYDLYKHLNAPCRNMIQLGSSTGKFLKMFRKNNWNVTGYDFSDLAKEKMQQRGVTTRQVDLDQFDESGALACSKQLVKDIARPVNIVMIRILEYLSLSAQGALLFLFMDYAASGSIIVLAGGPPAEAAEIARKNKNVSTETAVLLHPSFWASHFGGRIDMEFKHAETAYINDSILVIRKR
jgi:hypothetical protein